MLMFTNRFATLFKIERIDYVCFARLIIYEINGLKIAIVFIV